MALLATWLPSKQKKKPHKNPSLTEKSGSQCCAKRRLKSPWSRRWRVNCSCILTCFLSEQSGTERDRKRILICVNCSRFRLDVNDASCSCSYYEICSVMFLSQKKLDFRRLTQIFRVVRHVELTRNSCRPSRLTSGFSARLTWMTVK